MSITCKILTDFVNPCYCAYEVNLERHRETAWTDLSRQNRHATLRNADNVRRHVCTKITSPTVRTTVSSPWVETISPWPSRRLLQVCNGHVHTPQPANVYVAGSEATRKQVR